jgi:uncharacterized protein YidB (DUF937 family)
MGLMDVHNGMQNGPRGPISMLMAQPGLSCQDLLAGLSQNLPDAVTELTPDRWLPTEQELSRSI